MNLIDTRRHRQKTFRDLRAQLCIPIVAVQLYRQETYRAHFKQVSIVISPSLQFALQFSYNFSNFIHLRSQREAPLISHLLSLHQRH